MEKRLRTLIEHGVSRAEFDRRTGRLISVEFGAIDPGAIAEYVKEQVLEELAAELGEEAKTSLGLRLTEKSLMNGR